MTFRLESSRQKWEWKVTTVGQTWTGGVRREEIVENSTRGMGGSGGKDGHLW